MPLLELTVDADPSRALETLRTTSQERPTLVFKRSPICPVSWRAEAELKAWREGLGEDADLALLVIDVIAERPLARGLVAELGIAHESPQALWFAGGEVTRHGSHGDLTVAWFEAGRRG